MIFWKQFLLSTHDELIVFIGPCDVFLHRIFMSCPYSWWYPLWLVESSVCGLSGLCNFMSVIHFILAKNNKDETPSNPSHQTSILYYYTLVIISDVYTSILWNQTGSVCVRVCVYVCAYDNLACSSCIISEGDCKLFWCSWRKEVRILLSFCFI